LSASKTKFEVKKTESSLHRQQELKHDYTSLAYFNRRTFHADVDGSYNDFETTKISTVNDD
jgi:hypothetical protein